MDESLVERRARLAKEAEREAEIVRLAFRTFMASTEKGYDTGEAIAEVVLAITPLIKAGK